MCVSDWMQVMTCLAQHASKRGQALEGLNGCVTLLILLLQAKKKVTGRGGRYFPSVWTVEHLVRLFNVLFVCFALNSVILVECKFMLKKEA